MADQELTASALTISPEFPTAYMEHDLSIAFEDVVDAWVTEITTNVSGMGSAIVHRYAVWSPELLYAERGERHVAVFPMGEPETAENMTTDGSMLARQSYTILVWEDTGGDAENLVENVDADESWLRLYRDIRDRLFVAANNQLGSSQIMATRYAGGGFDRSGHLRVFEIRFYVAVPLFML